MLSELYIANESVNLDKWECSLGSISISYFNKSLKKEVYEAISAYQHNQIL